LRRDAVEHVLSHAEARPTGNRRRQIHVAPFWMVGRALELGPVVEQATRN